MADPKYANLPGIDLESPDVYETNELPEDDQAQEAEDEQFGDSVEQIKTKPGEAFDKFKGKSLEGTRIDFSDRVTGSRRTGYDARTEYEIVGEGEVVKETPQQKYQRLQHEIRVLAEEVNQIKDNVKAESSNEAMSPVTLSKQVEYLQQTLVDLHLDQILGPQAQLDIADPQGALQKRLLSQLQSYKTDSAKSKTPSKAGAGSADDHITYELYYKPEQAKFSHNARMAEVEQSLERLENLVGQQPEKLSALTAETNDKSLMGAVATLSGKSSLLDPTKLDQVEGRLQGLQGKLNAIAEKKATLDEEKLSKVTEVYNLMKKWDSVADTIPQVVERLVSLKDLHDQALQFSKALSHLDTAQQQILSLLQSHGDMLKQLDSTFGANTDVLKNNCSSLDARIKAISK